MISIKRDLFWLYTPLRGVDVALSLFNISLFIFETRWRKMNKQLFQFPLVRNWARAQSAVSVWYCSMHRGVSRYLPRRKFQHFPKSLSSSLLSLSQLPFDACPVLLIFIEKWCEYTWNIEIMLKLIIKVILLQHTFNLCGISLSVYYCFQLLQVDDFLENV